MKYVMLFLVTFSLSGCGLQRQINDLKNRSSQNEEDIDDLQNRVALLESYMSSARTQIVLLGDALSTQGSNVANQISNINASILALDANDVNFVTNLNNINQQIALSQNDLSLLTGRVSSVEGSQTTLGLSVNGLQGDLSSLSALVQTYVSYGASAYTQIQAQIAALQTQANTVLASTNSLASNVTTLQSQINSALVQIAVLQGYQNIVSIKDPCGAQGSYNEVFLKLSSGKYLASFSDNANGLNTRFAVLTDGNFQTTDGTLCKFTVSGNGTIISNEHN